MQKTLNPNWIGLGLAIFLAFVQFRLIANVLGPSYGQSVEAAWGVVIGEPHWREVQSRVLAPYIVWALSKIFPHYLGAHVAFSVITLATAGFLAFRIGLRHGGDLMAALLALLIFQAAFGFMLSRPWLYAWDYTELIAFLVFVEFVLSGRSWRWFAVLFAVAILNRESAFFIAIWMMLHPICRWLLGRLDLTPVSPFDRAMALAGLATMVIGAGVVHLLRQTLLVAEAGPRLFRDAHLHQAELARPLRNLEPNLQAAWASMAHPNYDMGFVVPLFVLLAVACSIALAWRYPLQLLAFGLVSLGMATGAVAIAVLFETRILLNLVPVVLTAALVLQRREVGWAKANATPNLAVLWRRAARRKQLAQA